MDAAYRTAQIAVDIPHDGISGFFSWPSSGKKISYPADIEKADASISALELLIENFINHNQIEKLHLIAHSMGNRILTSSLNNLSDRKELSKQLKTIHQIVLAAPDIDKDVFTNTILPKFKNIGERRTIYSSDKDEALGFSKFIRGGRPRIGDCGDEIYVADSVDTIDASNVPSRNNNHSYIFETKELLSDLYYLLGKGFAPIDRRLRAVKKENLKFWLFPE